MSDEKADVFSGEGLSDRQLLEQLVQAQSEHRAEVAALREQINSQKRPAPQQTANAKSQEELHEERLAEIREHSYYCPDCGRLSKYMRECPGLSADKPHSLREMVPVEELLGDDPSAHTPATETYA